MAASSDYISEVPDSHRVGETFKVELGFGDYSAADWSANLILINSANKVTIAGAANGDDFRFLLADTSAWVAGDYKWIAEVSATIDAATETYVASEGTISLEVDLATAATSDTRSHAKTVLEAIEAVIENRATQDQSSYSIAGRSLSRTPVVDLLVFKDRYQAIVNREERQDRRKRGLTSPDQIWTRF